MQRPPKVYLCGTSYAGPTDPLVNFLRRREPAEWHVDDVASSTLRHIVNVVSDVPPHLVAPSQYVDSPYAAVVDVLDRVQPDVVVDVLPANAGSNHFHITAMEKECARRGISLVKIGYAG